MAFRNDAAHEDAFFPVIQTIRNHLSVVLQSHLWRRGTLGPVVMVWVAPL